MAEKKEVWEMAMKDFYIVWRSFEYEYVFNFFDVNVVWERRHCNIHSENGEKIMDVQMACAYVSYTKAISSYNELAL